MQVSPHPQTQFWFKQGGGGFKAPPTHHAFSRVTVYSAELTQFLHAMLKARRRPNQMDPCIMHTLIAHMISSVPAVWRACCAQQTRAFHFRHTAHAAITPRSTNFSQWYLDIITSADLAESSPVKVTTMCMAHERMVCNDAYRAATFSAQMRALCGTTSGRLWTSGCALWDTTTCTGGSSSF